MLPNWCFQLVSHAWKVRIIGWKQCARASESELTLARDQTQHWKMASAGNGAKEIKNDIIIWSAFGREVTSDRDILSLDSHTKNEMIEWWISSHFRNRKIAPKCNSIGRVISFAQNELRHLLKASLTSADSLFPTWNHAADEMAQSTRTISSFNRNLAVLKANRINCLHRWPHRLSDLMLTWDRCNWTQLLN